MRIYLLLLSTFLLLTGCNTQDESTEKTKDDNYKVTTVKDSTIKETDRLTGKQVANRLTQIASAIPLVNDATAVVIGKYALVGIDIDDNIERSQVGTIKYSVGEALQNDPYGANAIIVADPDLNERIREISKDIQNGKPVRGILNELSDITSRIIPEIPGDLNEPAPTKTIENQKNSLNKHNQKQLKREQKKHSTSE